MSKNPDELSDEFRTAWVDSYISNTRHLLDQFVDAPGSSSQSTVTRAHDVLGTLRQIKYDVTILASMARNLKQELEDVLDGALPGDVAEDLKYYELEVPYNRADSEARSEVAEREQMLNGYRQVVDNHRLALAALAPQLSIVLQEFTKLKADGSLLKSSLEQTIHTASRTSDLAELVRMQQSVRAKERPVFVATESLRTKAHRLYTRVELERQSYEEALVPYRDFMRREILIAPDLSHKTRFALSEIKTFAPKHHQDVHESVNRVLIQLEARRRVLERMRSSDATSTEVSSARQVNHANEFISYVTQMINALDNPGAPSPIANQTYQKPVLERLRAFEKLLASCESERLQQGSWRQTGCNLARREESTVQAKLRYFADRLRLKIRILRQQSLAASDERLDEIEQLLAGGALQPAVELYDAVLAAGTVQPSP